MLLIYLALQDSEGVRGGEEAVREAVAAGQGEGGSRCQCKHGQGWEPSLGRTEVR